MRRALRLLAAPLVLASALLVGCGYQPGYGNRYPDDGYPRDTYPSGRYDARRVAYLPGGGEVVRQNGRLVLIDRNGRRYDYGTGRAEVCHRGRTQRVSDRSVQGHLRHGDRFGSCRRNGYSSGGYGYGNDGYYDDGGYYGGGYSNGGYYGGRTDRTRGYEGPIQGGAPRGATSGTGEVAPSYNGKNGRTDNGRSGNGRASSPRTSTPGRSTSRTDNGRTSSPRTGRSEDNRRESGRGESGRSSSESGRSNSGGRGKTSGGN